MINNIGLIKWQIRVFAACFIAYMAAYICRVNISVSLPRVQEAFDFSGTGVGMIGTAFFWAYAAGQLINGYLGDKVSNRIFVFIGLMLSVLLNILFGFSSMLIVMIVLWGANGVFQSMLWGPLVKILSNWFPAKKIAMVSFGMSITMIAGYLMAWGFSGIIMRFWGWRWTFWLPAAMVMALAFLWLILARNRPSDVGLPAVHSEEGSSKTTKAKVGVTSNDISLWRLIKGANLMPIAAIGAMQGIVRDGITLWSPKLLMDTQGISLDSMIGIVLIIPVVNFLGILFAGLLNKRIRREEVTITVLMALSAILSLGLIFVIRINTMLSVLMIAGVSAFMFGANPIMTTAIPMNYRRYNRVSAIAGFIDCSIYIGSGLAGVFTGFIVDHFGWNSVFALWCAVCVLGALTIGWTVLRRRRNAGITDETAANGGPGK